MTDFLQIFVDLCFID